MSSPLVRALGLAGGTVIAQGIALAMAPVLTRLYAPADFGVLATFTAISGFFPAIACLRYENAIVTADTDEDATALLAASTVIALGVSLLVGVAAAAMDGADGWRAPLYAVSAIASGLGAALTATMLRQQRFRALSASKFLPVLATSGLQVMLALSVADGGFGLIVATIAGQLALVVVGLASVRGAVGAALHGLARFEYPRLLRQHRDWPLRELPGALLAAAGVGLPMLLMAERFGEADAGHFSLAMRALAIPVSVIGASLSQVYFAHAARLRSDADALARFTVETVSLVGRCTLPVCLTLAAFGEEAFVLAFGASWATAGLMGALLAPFLLAWMTFSTIMPLLAAKDRLGLVIVAHAIATSRFLPLLWPGDWPSAATAVFAFSLFGFACYAAVGAVLLRLVDSSLARIAAHSLRTAAADWPWLGAVLVAVVLDLPSVGIAAGAVWTLHAARRSFALLRTGTA